MFERCVCLAVHSMHRVNDMTDFLNSYGICFGLSRRVGRGSQLVCKVSNETCVLGSHCLYAGLSRRVGR